MDYVHGMLKSKTAIARPHLVCLGRKKDCQKCFFEENPIPGSEYCNMPPPKAPAGLGSGNTQKIALKNLLLLLLLPPLLLLTLLLTLLILLMYYIL